MIKNKVNYIFKKKLYLYSILIIFTYILHLILFVHNPNGIQRYLYSAGMGDLFADFFNTVILSSDRDPYFANYFFRSNYLPFVHLILYPFSLLDNYKHFRISNCWHSHIAIFSCFFFIFISCLMLLHSIKCLCKKYNTNKIAFVSIIFSGVLLFTIERANIIILSSAFLFYFLAFYDSENEYLSNFASVCIAIAAVIKVYPVIFGLLYLTDYKKYWKKITVSASLAVILAFLPFLFFKHGFANIPQLFKILAGTPLNPNANFTERFDLKCMACAFLRIFHKEQYVGIFVSMTTNVTNILVIVSIVLFFLEKNIFRKICFITFPLLYVPGFSFFYCSMYIIPMFVLFFSDDNLNFTRFEQYLFFIFCFLIFTALQFGAIIKNVVSVRLITMNLSSLVVWTYLIVSETCRLITSYKKFTKTHEKINEIAENNLTEDDLCSNE